MTATRQGTPMRSVLIVLAVLLVLVGAAWGALVVLLPPERVNLLVRAQLGRMLAREARFESVSVGLWPPVRLTVKAPAIAEPGGFARGAAFRAAAIHLDLDVLAVLRQAVVVRSLELEEPVLHLVMRADGTTNLDGVMKPQPAQPQAGKPMDLDVKALTVKNGRLVLDQAAIHRRSTVVLNSKLSFASRGQGTQVVTGGDSHLSGFAFGSDRVAVASALNQSLAQLELRIQHDGTFDARSKRLQLGKLDLDLGRAKIALTGAVDDPGPRARLGLKARGQGIDFGDVLSYLSAADAKLVSGIRGSGRMDFDLAIGGALGPGRMPELRGTVNVSDASLRYPQAKVPLDHLSFAAHFVPDQVQVVNLKGAVAGQPLSGAVTVSRFKDPWIQFAMRGNLDLDAISPMLAPKDTKVGGRAAVNVTGAGRAKDPGSVALDGAAQLAQVSVASPTMPKPLEGVNGRIDFGRARAAIHGLTGRAGKSSFTLEASMTRPLAVLAKAGSTEPSDLHFTFDSPYLDAAEILPAGEGGAIPLNATGGGTVRIGRLINKKLDVSNIVADVVIQPNRIAAPTYSMTAYGGKVGGSAAFDLSNPASPAFKISGKAERLSADAFLSAFAPVHDMVTGTLTSSFDLAGDGTTADQLKRSLTAVGLASLLEGKLGSPALAAIAEATHIHRLRQSQFDVARMPFRIVRGQIVTDSARVSGGGCGDWRIVGAIGFDGQMNYALSGTIPSEVADRIGARAALAAGALTDEQGRLLLDLRLTGPARAPRVTWDTRAMRQRLAGRAVEALKEQSRGILQDIAQKTLLPADSGKVRPPDLKQDLKKRTDDLLQSILGGRKKAAPETLLKDTTAKAAPDTSKK